MERRAAAGVAFGGMMVLAGCLLFGSQQQPISAAPEYASWSPNAAEIQNKIGTAARPSPGMSDAERRNQFCVLFKDRYRHHDPTVAVGLRFISKTRLKLMCPARMEPCYMDQIALALWREARATFGAPIEIDIFDTFIGTTRIKIGELRVEPGDPEIAHITYDFQMLDLLSRPRHGEWPSTPMNPVSDRASR